MNFSVSGIPDLDHRLRSDKAVDLLRWLRTGFSRLGDEDLLARAAAFPPLVLAPERELLSQLGTALREAEAAGLKGPERLRSVVVDRISQPETIKSETIENLVHFWQLLASIGCAPSIFAVARGFLVEVLRSRPAPPTQQPSPEIQSLTHAVVSAVVTSSPMGKFQLSFLDFVHRHRGLWNESFVDLMVDCTLSQEPSASRRLDRSVAATRIRDWQHLRETLGDDLIKRANPETAVGRALLRSIARYLEIADAPSRTREEVALLRDRLWALGDDEAESMTTVLEASRALEFA